MKFSDIIGNERAIERIRHMVDEDRMPHALLLHGDPGIPKLALARATAQYIHCQNRTNGDSCGVCPSCVQHQTFNHADTFYSYPILKRSSDKDTNCADWIDEWKQFLAQSPIEDPEQWTRLLKNDNGQPVIYASESDNIVHEMSMTSFSAKYKVLIMWQPEKLVEQAANKLLKLIEEPSDDSLFILVSDNAKGILPTILSRCQRIELQKPSTQMIADYIARTYQVDMQQALAVAAPADGNVLQAERNMQRDSETKKFHEQFVKLMRLAYGRKLKELKAWSEGIAAYKREKARRFLHYCAHMVRENFIYNLHVPQLNYETQEEQQFSTRFAPFINTHNVERMLAEFNRAENDIQMNGNGKIILFDLAVKITILIR